MTMPRSDDTENDLQRRVDGYANDICAIDNAQGIIDSILAIDPTLSKEYPREVLEDIAHDVVVAAANTYSDYERNDRRVAACDLIEELGLSNIADAGSVAGAWLPEYSNKFIAHTYLGQPDSLSVDGMELLVAGGGPNIFVEYGEGCFTVKGYWGGAEATTNCSSDCLGDFVTNLMEYEQERLTEKSQSYFR
jgi:hypothetical protein